MIVNTYIDIRESDKFYNLLHNKCNNIKKSNLVIGDIILTYNITKTKVEVVIERKTISDLKNSYFNDGRGKEQCWRINKYCTGCKAFYLIEGIIYKNDRYYKALNQIILNIEVRDNISVIQTKNISDSVDVILRIKKCLEKYTRKKNISRIDSIDKYYKSNVSKSGNITPINYYNGIIRLIPGVGKKLQEVITKKWNTLPEFMNICKLQPNEIKKLRYGKRNILISINTYKNIINYINST